MRKLAIVAASLVLFPAISQAKTLEDLLVEKGVITRGEASSASMGGGSKVYWNGGTRLEFPDNGFTTQINTQIQTRYTFTDADEDAGDRNTSSFDVVRARLAISGTALNNEFSYMLQTDMVGSENDGSRSPELKDAWIQWNACDWASARMGQFKTAISRQFNTSSTKLQFADRSTASNTFDLGRQQGAAGKWNLLNDKLVMTAGIFNGQSTGEGDNRSGKDNLMTGVVSARYQAMGEMDAFEEGDVNYTEKAALNFGAAFAGGQSHQEVAIGGAEDKVDNYHLSVDANFKLKGISVNGEFFWQELNPDGDGEKVDPNGFYVQAGYFLTPKKWELAARFSMVDCKDGEAAVVNPDCAGSDQLDESTAGINYYWWKHNLKAQFNFVTQNAQGVSGGEDSRTDRWLFQLSSYF